MTKTSTSKTSVNLPIKSMLPLTSDIEPDAEIDLFYDQIKGQLDGLIRNPQDESIDAILAYSKSKK